MENVTDLEDAINYFYEHKSSDVIIENDLNNSNTGITEIEIKKDNDKALLLSGQIILSYAINAKDNFIPFDSDTKYVGNSNNIGLYRKEISVKKDDILYLKRETIGLSAYYLIY